MNNTGTPRCDVVDQIHVWMDICPWRTLDGRCMAGDGCEAEHEGHCFIEEYDGSLNHPVDE